MGGGAKGALTGAKKIEVAVESPKVALKTRTPRSFVVQAEIPFGHIEGRQPQDPRHGAYGGPLGHSTGENGS